MGRYRKPHEFTHNSDGTTTFVVESRKYGQLFVIVSTSQWERVQAMGPWSVSLMRDDGCYFACSVRRSDGTRTRLSLHRFITQCPKGLEVDHHNHNKFDNTDGNLIVCTRAENGRNQQKKKINTSGYIGVCYAPPKQGMINKRSKPWSATIATDGIHKHLGLYATKEEAALVRDEAAKKYHGRFAYLNFPNGPSKEILKIIKEGQESVPVQSSKYWGVTVKRRPGYSDHISVTMNFENNECEEAHFHQTVNTEEEGAVIRDGIIIEKGIQAPLNFPDGVPPEVLKIIQEGKDKAKAKEFELMKDRYIYRNPRGASKPYYVMMIYNGKQKRIGSFNDLNEARLARNKALSERSETIKFKWKLSESGRVHKL